MKHLKMILKRILVKCLKLTMDILKIILYPFIILINKEERMFVPKIENKHLLISATKLARRIRENKVTSKEVVQAYITRCWQVNSVINAIVETRFESAMTEAENVDELIASKRYSKEELEVLYPLLGVPITVKESIAVKGLVNNTGIYKRKRIPAVCDANAIALMKKAGAIPILVSNTPEGCMCWETFNFVTGTTKNPYDTRKTCGGSSGGEAALLGSAASVLGVGSDTAGSLRLPAMYNGVFAHKPSPFVISLIGNKPSSKSKLWPNLSTIGPMARYAEDLTLAMKIMNDPNGPQLRLDTKLKLTDIKFYYMEGDGSGLTSSINCDMKNAIRKIVVYFKKRHGIKVKKVNLKHINLATENTFLRLTSIKDMETISEPPITFSKMTIELFKKLLGHSRCSFSIIIHSFLILLRNDSDETTKKTSECHQKIKKEFTDLLRDDGVLFYPTFTRTATPHYDYIRHILDYMYVAMFNSLGLPVTNCPIGLTNNGMPIGVQVVSSPNCDHLTLYVAKELEKAFGGWIQPPQSVI